jgi:tetratricopeptide (TPR) repeat protein
MQPASNYLLQQADAAAALGWTIEQEPPVPAGSACDCCSCPVLFAPVCVPLRSLTADPLAALPSDRSFITAQNRGFSQRKLERYEEAIADYSAAVRCSPGHTKAYYNRAVALERLRRYEEAAADYSLVLQLDPGNAAALQNRGIAWLRLGRLEAAAADLDSALQLDGGAAAAWHARGEVRERLGDVAAALANLQRWVQHRAASTTARAVAVPADAWHTHRRPVPPP